MMVVTSAHTVAERLERVRRRIDTASERCGLPAGAVHLVAVSKLQAGTAILQAMAAGQQDFGESRAQELTGKASELGEGPVWHFVGRLQRNKVVDVVGLATVIHSVDRLSLVEAISRRALTEGVVQDVLVQVNVGGDPAKGGCAPEEAPRLADAIATLPAIRQVGLMTIPPLGTDPRPLFARLRRLRDHLRADHATVDELSMGMSADFETAIAEGATIVRIGEGIFGPRPAVGHR